MDPPLSNIQDKFFEEYMRNISIEMLNLDSKNKLLSYISTLDLTSEQLEVVTELISILIRDIAAISLRQIVKILEEIKNFY